MILLGLWGRYVCLLIAWTRIEGLVLCCTANDCSPTWRWSSQSWRPFRFESTFDLELHSAQMPDGLSKTPDATSTNVRRKLTWLFCLYRGTELRFYSLSERNSALSKTGSLFWIYIILGSLIILLRKAFKYHIFYPVIGKYLSGCAQN